MADEEKKKREGGGRCRGRGGDGRGGVRGCEAGRETLSFLF